MEENRKYRENIRTELITIENGDIDDYNFYDYIAENVLDVTYIINGDKTYRAVELCIGFGGPNVYIDTRTQELQLYWGSNHETLPLPENVCDELDEIYY